MELLAVIVLISLLTATVALSVRLPLAKVQRDHSLSQLKSLDALARDRASRGLNVWMEIDTQGQTARLIDDKNRELVAPAVLGSRTDVVNVVGVQQRRNAKAQVEYDQYGTSATYAVQIARDDLRHDREPKWLLFLGMTGQSHFVENRSAVDAIIQDQRRHSR